ncbi:TetR/AcrR family transcriptional repressor of lmrAB and yxaGH operons [Paenibacillus sp. DS2015]|uniref:TetR/AcrR family transcriptional regulator n=1 Tax=Paenibacillus sp. DS2015 TaxID=3373917 RepID=UPI003D1FA50E
MKDGHNSRDTILKTAMKLFFTQGYHATGLNQIINESHSPKGSLYYYFPKGKEELALECIECSNQIVSNKLKTSFANAKDVTEAMQYFIQEMAKEAEESQFTNFMPFSFWMAVETSCISNTLREACRNVFNDWQTIIADQLRFEGMEAAKALEIATVMVSLLEGALILALTKQDSDPLLTAVKFVPFLVKQCPAL